VYPRVEKRQIKARDVSIPNGAWHSLSLDAVFLELLTNTTHFSVSSLVLGLRYEDLINENDPDMEEALKLADYEVVTGRNRRLKRAIDLDFKKKLYTDYAPEVPLEETFKFELDEDIQKIRERDLEYAILNSYKK
jgi:ubiquinol-cytochrome c reductase subunit 7